MQVQSIFLYLSFEPRNSLKVYEKNFNRPRPEFTAKIKSGERRTYFIDVQKSKYDDYFLIVSESTRKPNSDQAIRNKIHVYKEDLNKFMSELENAVAFLKNNLMPDYDFDKTSSYQDSKSWETNSEDIEPVNEPEKE